jgi:putative peptidoglycan lipid II flippase
MAQGEAVIGPGSSPDVTQELPIVPAPQTEGSGSVLRHSAVMAAGSLVSRITGFLRTAVIAAALGGALVGDAYTTAQFVPSMIYELLLGGILGTVVVPVLMRARAREADRGEAYAQRLLTLAVFALGIVALLAVVAAPLLTIVLAGGNATPASRDLITTLGYLIMPAIFFYGLAALFGAVLNTRDHFAAPMWAPILNNLVVIATFGLYIALFGAKPLLPEQLGVGQILLIGLGTSLGIAVQTAGLWVVLRRVGFRWRWRFDLRSLHLGELARLGGWAFCYVAVSQIAVFAVIRLANEASSGGGAGPLIYNNAFLLLMMAHGIVAVSIITALMPRMSAAATERRYGDFTADLSRGTRMAAVVLVPIAVAYAVLAVPISRTLFQYGAFTADNALSTSVVLLVVAIALVPFSVSQLYTFAFYALPDTRTPALVNMPVVGVRVGVQVLLAMLLPAVWVAAGLMAGNAVSFVLAAVVSGLLLRRRVGAIGLRRILDTFVRAFIAGVGAFAVGWGTVWLLGRWLGDDRLSSLVQLAIGGAVIVVVYGGLALALRLREAREVTNMVRRRLSR